MFVSEIQLTKSKNPEERRRRKRQRSTAEEIKMGTLFIWMTTIAVVWSTIKYSIAEEIAATSSLPQIESGTNSEEYDSDSARKIIGSR